MYVFKIINNQSLYINFSIQLSYILPNDIGKNINTDSLNEKIQSEFNKNNIIGNNTAQESSQNEDFEYTYPPKIGYSFNVNTKTTNKWNSDIGLIKNIDGTYKFIN